MVNDEIKIKSDHKSRRDSFKKEKKQKRKHSSSSSSPDRKNSKKSKRKNRSSSSSSASSTSSEERERKKRKKEKKKAKKLKKREEKIKKKEKSKKDKTKCNDVPLELMEKAKAMAPMTKEEWEKRQNVVRRVFDEETGRHRLIKGDGEVLEEIVSRERHKNINKQATKGDGEYFQNKLNSSLKK